MANRGRVHQHGEGTQEKGVSLLYAPFQIMSPYMEVKLIKEIL